MVETPKDLRPFFHQCLSVSESAAGFKPVRFTEKQFRSYTIEEGRHLRARCVPG